MRELTLPEEIRNSAEREEVLRVYIDNGMLSISMANDFACRYEQDIETTWAMLLSDIALHVIDAISLETDDDKKKVKEKVMERLDEVRASDRNAQSGNTTIEKTAPSLTIAPTNEQGEVVEIVRIILMKETIHVAVYVGMWLENGNEEKVWGDVLYDLSSIIAYNLPGVFGKKKRKKKILDILLDFIENPTTDSYSGHYY